jgi:hypothetical protein
MIIAAYKNYRIYMNSNHYGGTILTADNNPTFRATNYYFCKCTESVDDQYYLQFQYPQFSRCLRTNGIYGYVPIDGECHEDKSEN